MKSFFKSLGYAWNGIRIAVLNEQQVQRQLIISLLVLTLGLLFRFTGSEWMRVIACMAAVIALELVNTAIEVLCNLVQPGLHPMVKRIKDISAGAVLVASIAAAVIGGLLFYPHIQKLFL